MITGKCEKVAGRIDTWRPMSEIGRVEHIPWGFSRPVWKVVPSAKAAAAGVDEYYIPPRGGQYPQGSLRVARLLPDRPKPLDLVP